MHANREYLNTGTADEQGCGGFRAGNRVCADRKKNGEHIANIILNLVFLWIVNHLQEWNLSFIRDNFGVVLWALNMSILVQAGGNLLLLLAGSVRPVRYLLRMVMEAASFIAQMVLYYIYPFDFSHVNGLVWMDTVLPVLLIIGMVVSAIKILSSFWKLLFRH